MLITDTIHKLQNIQHEGLTLHAGASASLISECESTYGVTLPDDFRAFYSFSDGLEIDEDIFNMIPLAESIERKNRNKQQPLYIAEYMIYSDMWQLEINPDDCNDYKIIIEAKGNKLVLTNSLSEFIDRFLKGGVFEPGGLYDWQREVEAQPIYPTKLKTVEALLTVFYRGLNDGLISKEQVVEWADRLIMHENEPESFFIDLSLAHDKNELISLLNARRVQENDVAARAILGLLYQRLSAGVITAREAVAVLYKHDFWSPLTNAERIDIDNFADEIWLDDSEIDLDVLTQQAMDFLAHYKAFEIENYKDWYGLSSGIGYKLKEDEKKGTPEYQPKIKQWMVEAMFYSLLAGLLIMSLLACIRVEDQISLNKIRSDSYHAWMPSFIFFPCYFLFKIRKWAIKKLAGGLRKVFG